MGKKTLLQRRNLIFLLFLLRILTGYLQSGVVPSDLGHGICRGYCTVTVHIKKIREKIEFNTAKPQYIETIWGVGYRFKV